jgi:hypothetical protein
MVMIGLHCYGVRPALAEDIHEWTHEFTEGAINKILFDNRLPNIFFSIIRSNHLYPQLTIAHVLSSLVTHTHVDFYGNIKTLSPDEFWILLTKEAED